MDLVATSSATPPEPGPRVASLDLDWRFLLPPGPRGSYRRLLLLGADEPTTEQVRALDVASDVITEPRPGADAVVCLAGASLALEAAARYVAREGVLYYESRRPLVRPPTRTLRRVGLDSVATYWVHPGFTGQRTYFPLDATNALDWYSETLHSGKSRLGLARATASVAAAVGPTRVARVLPRVAVVASAADERRPAPLTAPVLPESLRGADLRPLLLIHGTALTRAVMLPFSDSSEQPLAVVKISRTAGAEPEPREHALLRELRAGVDSGIRSSVPEPLGASSQGGYSVAAETFLRGQWLHARLSRPRLRLEEAVEDLDLATGWITRLHAEFPLGTTRWGENERQHYVDGPLAAYAGKLGTTADEAGLFEQLRKLEAALSGTPLPVVWQHGDYSNLNVMRDGHEIRVIDWEWAERGMPLEDVLHFARLWLYLVRRASREESFEAFEDLFLRPSFHDGAIDAARAAIGRYMHRLELEPKLLPLLLVSTCVRRAAYRVDTRATLDAEAAPRTRNRYVSYLDLIGRRFSSLVELAEAVGRRP